MNIQYNTHDSVMSSNFSASLVDVGERMYRLLLSDSKTGETYSCDIELRDENLAACIRARCSEGKFKAKKIAKKASSVHFTTDVDSQHFSGRVTYTCTQQTREDEPSTSEKHAKVSARTTLIPASSEITAAAYGRQHAQLTMKWYDLNSEILFLMVLNNVEHIYGHIPPSIYDFTSLCIRAFVCGTPYIFPAMSHDRIWLTRGSVTTEPESYRCDCANLLWISSVVRIFGSSECVTPHIKHIEDIPCARFVGRMFERDAQRRTLRIPSSAQQVEILQPTAGASASTSAPSVMLHRIVRTCAADKKNDSCSQ